MGLDGVELVMAVEESFGITLSNDDAEKIFTPGMLIDAVYSKVKTTDQKVCATQRAFYLLRNGVMRVLNVPRNSISLDTNIKMILGGRPEAQVWHELKTAVRAQRWPTLVRPKWLTNSLCISCLCAYIALVTQFYWLFALFCTILLAIMLYRGSKSWRTCIPPRYARLRELTYFALSSDSILWTRDQVAVVIKKIVIEQLGLKESDYREDARFIEDLGMD